MGSPEKRAKNSMIVLNKRIVPQRRVSESHQSPQTDAEKSQASQTLHTHRTLGDEQESGGETRESQSYRGGRFGKKELDEREIELSVSTLGRRSRDSAFAQTIGEYSR